MKGTRIAVVVVSWNYGDFLGEALASVEDQTEPPAELLILDDASTDQTRDVALEFLGRYARSHPEVPAGYHRNPERLGFAAGVNALVEEKVRSSWVAILSADDWLLRGFLAFHERAIAAQESDPRFAVAWCVGEYRATTPLASRRDLNGASVGLWHWDVDELKRRNYIHGSAVFRRAVFLEVGGFPTDRGVEEDHALWQKFAERGYCGAPIPTRLFVYRLHDQGHRNFGEDERRLGKVGPWRA